MSSNLAITPDHAPRPPRARLLGELLVERGIVSAADIHKALAFQEQFSGRIGSILVRLGAVSEETLLPVLSDQLGVPLLAGSEWPEQPDAIRELLAGSGYSLDWWLDNGVAAWTAESGPAPRAEQPRCQNVAPRRSATPPARAATAAFFRARFAGWIESV